MFASKHKKLKKNMIKFCRMFGLRYALSISTEVTQRDVQWYTVINAPTLEELKLDPDPRKMKRNLKRYFRRTKSGIGKINEDEIKHMKELLEGRARNKRDEFLINYLKTDSKAREEIEHAIKVFSNPEVKGSLAFFKNVPPEMMEHEAIHYILNKNGIIFRYNPLTEGVCVYLHMKFYGGPFGIYLNKDPLTKKYRTFADFFKFLFEDLPEKPISPRKISAILYFFTMHEHLLLRAMYKFIKEREKIEELRKEEKLDKKELRKIFKKSKTELKREKLEEKYYKKGIKFFDRKKELVADRKFKEVEKLINEQIEIIKKEFKYDVQDIKQEYKEEREYYELLNDEKKEVLDMNTLFSDLKPILSVIDKNLYVKLQEALKEEIKEEFETKYLSRSDLAEYTLGKKERKLLERLLSVLEEEERLAKSKQVIRPKLFEVEEKLYSELMSLTKKKEILSKRMEHLLDQELALMGSTRKIEERIFKAVEKL